VKLHFYLSDGGKNRPHILLCNKVSNLRDGIEEDKVSDDEIQTDIDALVFYEFVLRNRERQSYRKQIQDYNKEFNNEQPGPSKRIRLERWDSHKKKTRHQPQDDEK